MEQPTVTNAAADDRRNKPWSEAQAVEMWKYFGGIGGGDKNTMVQVCNWLLGFSVIIVSFAFGKELKPNNFTPQTIFSIGAFFGLTSSIVSALVSLIYGGYASWNWAKADQIARAYGWRILDPDDVPWTDDQKRIDLNLLARCVRGLSAPTPDYYRLAPIFLIYFGLSLLSAVAHITLMVWANSRLCCSTLTTVG